jgi:small GTP-binding protein
MRGKKVCVLGDFAVGKTSLIRRFVNDVFCEDYQATLGVRIDSKSINLAGLRLDLVLWDSGGENALTPVRMSQLRGASGFMLVVDGTRRATLDTALRIHKQAEETCGAVPFVLLLNKADREAEWDIAAERVKALVARGWSVIKTSAKTGQGVEEAFLTLSRRMSAREAPV